MKCDAEAWYYKPKIRTPKTLRCKQPAGHSGAHMAKDRYLGDLVWERDISRPYRDAYPAKEET